jgi:glutathione S-transferase
MAVTLRYFACRGRAQPLRSLLVDHGVEFRDLLAGRDFSWPDSKDDRSVGGPFAGLPVLQWADFVVSETQAIAGYLARRLGHYRGRSDEEIARLEMVTSAAYLNLLAPVTELIAPFPAPPDQEWTAFLEAFVVEIPLRVARFESLLASIPTPYFGGESPAGADHFLFEALDMWREVLGPPLQAMLDRCPRLAALMQALPARPALRDYLASGRRPTPITVSPREPEIRQRLAAHVARRS